MKTEELQAQANTFNQLTHPQLINERWEKSRYAKNTSAIPILNGAYTKLGFVPITKASADLLASSQAMTPLMDMTDQWAKTLHDGGCYYAFGSEGDLNWFPIFLPKSNMDTPEEVAEGFGAIQAQEIMNAYQQQAIRKNNSSTIVVHDIAARECLFWEDHKKEMMLENQQSYEAYCKVSQEMRTKLDRLACIEFYPDYIEFPIAIIGQDPSTKCWMGVITPVVWS